MNLNLSTRAYKKMKLYPISPTSGLKQAALNLSTVPAGSKALKAMTLTELLVAVAVGSLVLMVMAMVFMTSAHSVVAMGHYVNMDASSRNALDHMTLQIRQAGNLTEFSPTHLKFSMSDQTNSVLVYDWDSATRRLTEWKTGDTVTNTRACVQVPSHTIMAVPTPLAKTIDPMKREMSEGMGEGHGVSPSSGPTRNNSPTTKSMMPVSAIAARSGQTIRNVLFGLFMNPRRPAPPPAVSAASPS